MGVNGFVYGVRTLRRSPAFAITAGLTLALGIACSTAMFSVSNAVLLRPLPYADAERLVTAWVDYRKPNVRDVALSNADFVQLRRLSSSVFDDLAGVFTFRVMTSRQDGRPERIYEAEVTTNFFRMLGARVALGRDFIDADSQANHVQSVGVPPATAAILSYDYWQRRYGANPAIIGHELAGTGQRGPIIVGVLAQDFQLYFPPSAGIESRPDVWIANNLGADPRILGLRAIGKLKAGAAVKQSEEQVEAIAQQIRAASAFDAASDMHIRLEPMLAYTVAESRPSIIALSAASLVLLLIACLNVANLAMVRTSGRTRELAVRAALGADSTRLIQYLLTEPVLVSVLGVVSGLGLALALLRVFQMMVPASLPRAASIHIDWPTFGFAAIAGFAATMIIGFSSALRGRRLDLMNALRGSPMTSLVRPARRAGDLMVVLQVALSFVLLVASGLLVRTLYTLETVDVGYDPHGVLTFLAVRNWDNSAPVEKRLAFLNSVQERLRALPQVESVTATPFLPLTGEFGGAVDWSIEESLPGPRGARAATLQSVLPGYFETLRTKLIAGRSFEPRDNQPQSRVAIVDDLFAAKAFPNRSPIGRRIRLDFLNPPWVEIVGVVAHQRLASLAAPGREEIFVTDGMVGFGVGRYWALRLRGNRSAAVPAVVAALAALDPQILTLEIQPMDAIVSRAGSTNRLALVLIGAFAIIATLLAAVGLYGVLSTVVRQRSLEIGVRVAVGANPMNIMLLVIAHGFRLTIAGITAGLLGAYAARRLIDSLLVGVRPTDPLTFCATGALFLVIAATACWSPSRWAARLDPVSILHE